MSAGTGYQHQRWVTNEDFPSESIKKYWDEGYRITNITYGSQKWAVVFTKGSGYTKQMYHTNSDFPREKIDQYWSMRNTPSPGNNNPGTPVTAPRNPTIFGVFVGVATYSSDMNRIGVGDLKHPDEDATAMYNFYMNYQRGSASNLKLLVNYNATKDNILDACREIYRNAGPNDLVIFFFSGHGAPQSFAVHDHTLFHEEIRKIINTSNAKIKICIADACHAGSWNKSTNRLTKSSDPDDNVDRFYNSLANAGAGYALFMASKENETSIDDMEYGQGLFTYYLIEALKGKADRNNDRTISLQEAYDYVYRYVSLRGEQRWSNPQHPQLNGSYDNNTPLATVR